MNLPWEGLSKIRFSELDKSMFYRCWNSFWRERCDQKWCIWSSKDNCLIKGAYYAGCQVNPPDHPERICWSFFSRIGYLCRSRLRSCGTPHKALTPAPKPPPRRKGNPSRGRGSGGGKINVWSRPKGHLTWEEWSKVFFSGLERSMCDRGQKSICPERGDQTLCFRSSKKQCLKDAKSKFDLREVIKSDDVGAPHIDAWSRQKVNFAWEVW